MLEEDFVTEKPPSPSSIEPSMASSHQLATSYGVQPQRVQVMKASFFAEDDDDMDLTMGANTSQTLSQPLGLHSRDQSLLSLHSRPPVASPARHSDLFSLQRGALVSDLRDASIGLSSATLDTPPASSRLLSTGHDSPAPAAPRSFSFAQRTMLQPSSQPMLGPRDVIGSPMPAHLARLPKLPSGRSPSDDDFLGHADLQSISVNRQRSLPPVPMENSVTRGKQRLVGDAGLMLGRSFRVGWGPGWRFAHCGSAVGSAQPASSGPGVHRMVLSGFAPAASEQKAPYSVTVEQVLPAPYLYDANTTAQVCVLGGGGGGGASSG